MATLEWLAPSLAYLVVPSFSNRVYRAAGLDFRDEMRRIFEELRRGQATRLILDLRENGGGSEPNESILFSHLVAEPLRKYAAVEARGEELAVSSRSGRRYGHRVFDADELNFQQRLPDGRLSRLNVPPEGLMTHWEPAAPVFSGRLVVLAGGATFSGGAELASMLYHRAPRRVRRRGNRRRARGQRQRLHLGDRAAPQRRAPAPSAAAVPLLPGRACRATAACRRIAPRPPRVEEIGVRRDRLAHRQGRGRAGIGDAGRGAMRGFFFFFFFCCTSFSYVLRSALRRSHHLRPARSWSSRYFGGSR